MTLREQIENDIYFKTLLSCNKCGNKGYNNGSICEHCIIKNNQDRVYREY